jgi:drug/metabolite transporter (DMT)-like permease
MAGIFWATVAGVGFGFFQIFNRKAGRYIDPYRGTFMLIAISSLILVAASLLTEDLSLLKTATFAAFANFALAGVVHFFFGWTFLSLSQQKVGAARTGALIGAAPLFAAIIAWLLLGETLNLPAIVGILLVVGGVYLVSSDVH